MNEFKNFEKILILTQEFKIEELEDVYPEKHPIMKMIFRKCEENSMKFICNISEDDRVRFIGYFSLKYKLAPHLFYSLIEKYQIIEYE